jgi:mRNA-degrading endonuclease RelE of RelBE toxin-antitoxin system
VTYDVELSEQGQSLLEELHREDRKNSRELALLLLRFEKDPRPDGSRKLVVQPRAGVKGSWEERVWDVANFRIVYRINTAKRLVEVGLLISRRM